MIADLPSLPFSRRSELPNASGIYFVVDPGNSIVYIGKAYNLRKRWMSHHRRPQVERGQFSIYWMELPQESLTATESEQIAIYKPEWNGSRVEGGSSTIWLDQEAVDQVDEMAEQLSELVNVKITRTAVVRRALSELYSRLKEAPANDHE